ncbi:MAG: glycoside hydrolase family 76 protein [Tannerellaceae bacterium]|nr:glycoside hydrolase family 76 protein [Tannerellaceae bacterium]
MIFFTANKDLNTCGFSLAVCFFIVIVALASCSVRDLQTKAEASNLKKAETTLDSIFQRYRVSNSCLLRETFPFGNGYNATYLASEDQNNVTNEFAYLWPYSGVFSAVNVLLEVSKDDKYLELLNKCILPGLEEYFDTVRSPYAYASYIFDAPLSDRFYDDNVWLGIDFTDIYQTTKNKVYLEKAELIWQLILSGTDEKLGGGAYWCEQKKESKNTCSNAPGAVYAFKLFEATGDSSYFFKGKELYEWTKSHLQDPDDFLYFDNISLTGKVNKTKFAYNSGQMMQSAALLYKLTKEAHYLTEAQNIAKSCYSFFFADFTGKENESFRLIKRGDVWFTAVMFRGFIELYRLDKNKLYIDTFSRNLAYAWDNSRDADGLFNVDFSGEKKDRKKWLLTQAAMVEMFARLYDLETSTN